jgi:phenylacetate-CoA ligase
MVPGPLLSYAFKDVPGLVRSQIEQVSEDLLIVRLVAGDEFDRAGERAIRHGLEVRLGTSVSIKFEYVEEIPLSGRGKYRWVISNVPLKWGDVSTANLYQEDDAA